MNMIMHLVHQAARMTDIDMGVIYHRQVAFYRIGLAMTAGGSSDNLVDLEASQF